MQGTSNTGGTRNDCPIPIYITKIHYSAIKTTYMHVRMYSRMQ